MSESRSLIAAAVVSAALMACAGEGQECMNDEAGDTRATSLDMGVLRPIPMVPEGGIDTSGVLQTEGDVDWYQFIVEDPWSVVWRPKIRFSVYEAPGSGHSRSSFRVEIFNHEGHFVEELDGGHTRLNGQWFYDDGLPYFIRVSWRDAATLEPTPSLAPRAVVGDDSPSPSAMPSQEVSPTASSSPSFAPTPEASPSPSSPQGPAGLTQCSRYRIRVSN